MILTAEVTNVQVGFYSLEGLMDEKGVYKIGEKPYNDSLPERCYQLALADLIEAQIESSVDSGRIDIETSDFVIEVKKASAIKEAIGQVLSYSTETNKTPCIAFYGQLNPVFITICQQLNIILIDVSCLYKKTAKKRVINSTQQSLFQRPDYSNFDILTKQLLANDLLAKHYVTLTENRQSVLKHYLSKKDHYLFIKCWELITRLEVYNYISFVLNYDFLYVENELANSTDLVQDFFLLLLKCS